MIYEITLPKLSVHEALAVLLYKISNPLYYPTLSNYLGVHQYINPDKRSLRESALSIKQKLPSAHGAFIHWQWLVLLENHYTSSEQSNIIGRILWTS